MKPPAVSLLGVLTLLAGCGGAADPVVRPGTCDATVAGACIVGAAPNLDAAHLERQIALALAYWSAPPETLAGWAIVFSPGEVACPTALGSGCTWWDSNRTIELEVLDAHCLETAQLVHEIGHVIHHDGGHTGPWWNWTAEQDRTWEIVRSPGASPACAASRYYVAKPGL
jgi:hypothetical protein